MNALRLIAWTTVAGVALGCTCSPEPSAHLEADPAVEAPLEESAETAPTSETAAPETATPETATPETATPESARRFAPRSASREAAAIERLARGAQRVAAADLDGDGRPELVRADADALVVLGLDGRERGRAAAPGGIQTLTTADVDGDGRAEVLAGWGRSRERMDAPVRVSLYHLTPDGLIEERVVDETTERPDVAAVVPVAGAAPPELLVAFFTSRYMVRIARARRGARGWTLDDVDTIRMATSLAVGDVDGDGARDLIVGRVYGDAVGEDGDAFVLRPDGSQTALPVTRGLRGLTIADLDGDREGASSILAADGWHQHYGERAEARLTRVDLVDGAPRAELIDRSEDEFTFWDVVTADLDGDGQLEIVTRGNLHVRVLARSGDGWTATTIGPACEDLAVADLTSHDGLELLLACRDGARVVELGAAAAR